MKLSINKYIVNKNDYNAHQSKGFESKDLTVGELVSCISNGYAFSYQYDKNYRKVENFICSDIIAADFDSGITLEEAMQNEYFINNACILYTTPSHTPENHRFRVIFELPITITDKNLIRAAQTGLTRKFPADVAAVDAARQFYGSRGSKPHTFGKILSEENLDELIKLGKEKLNLSDSSGSKKMVAGSRSSLTIGLDTAVKDARGDFHKLSDLEKSTPVFCPVHHDKKPSAFTTQSKCGTIGIRCQSCQQTFWAKDKQPVTYDFYAFDEQVRKAHVNFTPTAMDDESGLVVFDDTNHDIILNDNFLEDLPIFEGITLIKSPKGTGKTQYLKRVVKEMKAKKKKVLLVGHRRSLLRALSKELDLDCYLGDDKKSESKIRNSNKKYFAVSVDSISTCLNTASDKFDVILIDESEQVFSHLISDTMQFSVRNLSYKILKHYIRMSKTCIAVDADLNNITMSSIGGFGNKNPLIATSRVLNLFKPEASQIEIFASEQHLIGEIFEDLHAGKRLYICSNSKKKIDVLANAIKEKFGAKFPIISLTKDNSEDKKSTHFIRHIKTEILNYQAVLTSPVLGTGVDITFPDAEKLVDGVYGLFEARVNTHTDIDQQLSRVRHPGFVRVWISPEKFNFETETDPIRQELAESGVVPDALVKHSWQGVPEYKLDDLYLNLYTTILAAQRASKNSLKENFIELKRYNGWQIIDIATDKEVSILGGQHKKVGKDLENRHRIQGILDAESAGSDEIDKLLAKKEDVSQVEKYVVARYFIEHFYFQPITENLLIKDDGGQYQDRIKRLEKLLAIHTIKPPLTANPETLLLQAIFSSAKILNASGSPDSSVKITLESLGEFSKYCLKQKAKINRILKVDIRADTTTSPLNQLNIFLKMCGLVAKKAVSFNRNKIRVYEYAIDASQLEEALAVIKIRKANI